MQGKSEVRSDFLHAKAICIYEEKTKQQEACLIRHLGGRGKLESRYCAEIRDLRRAIELE